MATEQYIRVSALLTEDQIERLKERARKKGVGMATVIRWAVDEYVPPFFLTSISSECIEHSNEIPDTSEASIPV